MPTNDQEDNSWEDVYQANGVRCDIEDSESSPNEPGVCPTPLVNPFLSAFLSRSGRSTESMVTLDVFV
jgi:hypothetical protein